MSSVMARTSELTRLAVVELEREMMEARRHAVKLDFMGHHATAALYAGRLDLLLDEWARRRTATRSG